MWAALVIASMILASFGGAGIVALRRFAPGLDTFEHVVYGVPLGAVLASLAILVSACLVGLGPGLVAAVTVVCAAVTIQAARRVRWSMPRGMGLVAVLVLGAFALRFLLFWSGAFEVDGEGLWASHLNLWGDGAQHLGDTTSFAYGDNFPPVHPRFAGHAFNYHYLTAITTAVMVTVGVTPWGALDLHGFVFSVFVMLAVYAFARKLGLSAGAAALAVTLLLLGGGFWWWSRMHGIEVSNRRWQNVFFSLIAPQRGMLYGVPLGLLALRFLSMRSYVAAGLVAGVLPFAHLGTLLSLALLTPFLFVAFPGRGWIKFFGVWALVAGPQVLLQQAGSAGAAEAMRWAPGWVAPPQPWVLFWLASLGAFVPLLAASFFVRDLVPPAARRFLLAFQPLFVLSNLFVFQPWDWDNTKVLFWWYLASCLLVAALLVRLWGLRPRILVRSSVAIVVFSMILSGLVEHVDEAVGLQRNILLTRDEIEVARLVRESTPPRAVFATGNQHNNPVSMLAGRRVLTTYAGWLWSQGIDGKERERELRSILTLSPDAERLIVKYGVGFVSIGPDERDEMGADPVRWRERYPVVVSFGENEVFSVAPNREATAATKAPRE